MAIAVIAVCASCRKSNGAEAVLQKISAYAEVPDSLKSLSAALRLDSLLARKVREGAADSSTTFRGLVIAMTMTPEQAAGQVYGHPERDLFNAVAQGYDAAGNSAEFQKFMTCVLSTFQAMSPAEQADFLVTTFTATECGHGLQPGDSLLCRELEQRLAGNPDSLKAFRKAAGL